MFSLIFCRTNAGVSQPPKLKLYDYGVSDPYKTYYYSGFGVIGLLGVLEFLYLWYLTYLILFIIIKRILS